MPKIVKYMEDRGGAKSSKMKSLTVRLEKAILLNNSWESSKRNGKVEGTCLP